MAIREDIRRQIIVLARRPRARSSASTSNRPADWQPDAVINPEGGLPFTDFGAWDFIATCVEEGHEIETVVLRKPAGATGYVMKIRLEPNCPHLYVKVQLGGGKIFGRSFHYSKH